jgi:hypothetical protein
VKLSAAVAPAPVPPPVPKRGRRLPAVMMLPPRVLAAMADDLGATTYLAVELPLRLSTLGNAKGHWRQKAALAKAHRKTAADVLRSSRATPPAAPLLVTITRIAPAALDSDNLVGSAKHVRDGIADWLGIDDRSPLVTWVVEQERGAPRTYGARIFITRRPS